MSTGRVESLVIETSDYRISLEPYSDIHFVHMTVDVWNRRTFREITDVVLALEKHYNLRVFVHPTDEKLLRFTRLFGGYVYDTVIHPIAGETYKLLRRTPQWEECLTAAPQQATSVVQRKRHA